MFYYNIAHSILNILEKIIKYSKNIVNKENRAVVSLQKY